MHYIKQRRCFNAASVVKQWLYDCRTGHRWCTFCSHITTFNSMQATSQYRDIAQYDIAILVISYDLIPTLFEIARGMTSLVDWSLFVTKADYDLTLLSSTNRNPL